MRTVLAVLMFAAAVGSAPKVAWTTKLDAWEIIAAKDGLLAVGHEGAFRLGPDGTPGAVLPFDPADQESPILTHLARTPSGLVGAGACDGGLLFAATLDPPRVSCVKLIAGAEPDQLVMASVGGDAWVGGASLFHNHDRHLLSVDGFLAAFDDKSRQLWVKRFDLPVAGIAATADGALVLLEPFNSAARRQPALLALDRKGGERWRKPWPLAGDAASLVGDSGRIFAAGSSTVARLGPDGAVLWRRSVKVGELRAVTVAPDGIVVAGNWLEHPLLRMPEFNSREAAPQPQWEIAAVERFADDGSRKWRWQDGSRGHDGPHVQSVAADASGVWLDFLDPAGSFAILRLAGR